MRAITTPSNVTPRPIEHWWGSEFPKTCRSIHAASSRNAPACQFLLSGLSRRREGSSMPPDPAEARRWLEKADRDERTSQAALAQSPPITDTAAFHAQQAAEKLLKAFLVARNEPFERTHDLEPLCELCARHDTAFEAFSDRVAPLTAFAVRFRYP